MSKEMVASGIIKTVGDFLEAGLPLETYKKILESCGIPQEEIEGYMTPQLTDPVEAVIAENKLYEKLLEDEEFGMALDVLLTQTQMNKLMPTIEKNIANNVGKRRESIQKIELRENGGYWMVLINDKTSVRIPTYGKEKIYLRHMYNIATDKESEVDNKKLAKGVTSWFNTNIKNPIYGQIYRKTKIIRYSSDFLRACDGIVIKELSQKRMKSEF